MLSLFAKRCRFNNEIQIPVCETSFGLLKIKRKATSSKQAADGTKQFLSQTSYNRSTYVHFSMLFVI